MVGVLVIAVATTGGLLGAGGAGGQEATMLVGAAERDITPPPGLMLWGYSDRFLPARGKRDPLLAKAVVIGDGAEKIAVVGLDLGRTPPGEACDRLGERAQQELGLTGLFLVATHTHSAPAVDRQPASNDEVFLAYGKRLQEQIFAAIKEADEAAVAARIGVGRGRCTISHNRRLVRDDGTVEMLWANMKRQPTQPVDHEVIVVRFETAAGRPIATLVNYACHPVVLGPDHVNYSADYCGVMAKKVTSAVGGMCVFLQGAAGDLNPYADKMSQKDGAERLVREVGEELADEVIRVVRRIETAAPQKPSVRTRRRTIHVATRYDMQDPNVIEALCKRYPRSIVMHYAKALGKEINAPVTTAVLNGDLALAGFPGEFFVEHQLAVKRRSPVKDTLFLGYCNEYFAYFPTVRACAEGGYGADTATYVEVGAGERLGLAAIVDLYYLCGKVSDLPVPPVND